MIRCCSRSFVGLGAPFDISTGSMQARSGQVLWMSAGSHVHDNPKTCHSERAGLLRMTCSAKVWGQRFASCYRKTCQSQRSEESPVFSIVRVVHALRRRPCARTHRLTGGPFDRLASTSSLRQAQCRQHKQGKSSGWQSSRREDRPDTPIAMDDFSSRLILVFSLFS